MNSVTGRALIAFVVGLSAGMGLNAYSPGVLPSVQGWIEPIGTIWVNAIRMTVIPLVVSMVVVGVATIADGRTIGQLTVRTFVLFVAILSATALAIAAVAPLLYAGLRIDPAAVASLRESAAAVPPTSAAASLKEWLLSVIPTNPIKAAVDGAMLPLFVFTLAIAFAVRQSSNESARLLIRFFEGMKEATLVLVGWVLLAAPFGVFALALALGARVGSAAAGAIGYYLVVMCGMHVVVGLVMYLLPMLRGISPARFAAAVAGPQVVGLSTRSSMASLPAMIEAAGRLGVPQQVAGFVLPLAVSAFRLSSPVNWTIGAIFIARLYGVELGPLQIALIALASVILNPASPPVPSGGLFVQAPVYLAVGLPVEGLGILIAIDAIPDLFKTLLNVTADVAVATVAEPVGV
jgi:proton glutamate symport protein